MSVQAIMAHKMRSLLTMLGIIIGIASVVSVVALGNGSEKKILADISAMGTNTISIFPGRGFGDRRSGRIKTLTIDDAKVIAKQSYVASATPRTNSSGTLTYRNTDLSAPPPISPFLPDITISPLPSSPKVCTITSTSVSSGNQPSCGLRKAKPKKPLIG